MPYRSFRSGKEPVWRPVSGALYRELPYELASWLIDTASLTRRLREMCGTGFKVSLVDQRWQRPMFSERVVLEIRNDAFALVRQVRLLCGKRSLVFARTVMPAGTLKGAGRRFAHLGSKPLGGMLFADRRIVRCEMEVARIDPGHALHAAAAGAEPRSRESLWGRRSMFLIQDRPLLVCEIFLPAITRQAARRGVRGPEK